MDDAMVRIDDIDQPGELAETTHNERHIPYFLHEFGATMGNVPSATAILDRFLHHSDVLTITGRSYRLRNSENGSKSAKAPTGSATEKKNGQEG